MRVDLSEGSQVRGSAQYKAGLGMLPPTPHMPIEGLVYTDYPSLEEVTFNYSG